MAIVAITARDSINTNLLIHKCMKERREIKRR